MDVSGNGNNNNNNNNNDNNDHKCIFGLTTVPFIISDAVVSKQ